MEWTGYQRTWPSPQPGQCSEQRLLGSLQLLCLQGHCPFTLRLLHSVCTTHSHSSHAWDQSHEVIRGPMCTHKAPTLFSSLWNLKSVAALTWVRIPASKSLCLLSLSHLKMETYTVAEVNKWDWAHLAHRAIDVVPYLSTTFVSPFPGSPLLSSPEPSAPLLTKQQSCTRGSKNPGFIQNCPPRAAQIFPSLIQGLSQPGPGPPESWVCQLCEPRWAPVTLPSTALLFLPPGSPMLLKRNHCPEPHCHCPRDSRYCCLIISTAGLRLDAQGAILRICYF